MDDIVEQENNAFSPEDLADLLANRGYTNMPPQLVPSCRSNSIGDPGDYIQFVFYMRQVLSPSLHQVKIIRPLIHWQEAERQFRVLSKSQGVAAQLNCSNIISPQRCSLILSKLSLGARLLLLSSPPARDTPNVSGSLRVVNLSCNGLSSSDISAISPSLQRMPVRLRQCQLSHHSSCCRLYTPLILASTT